MKTTIITIAMLLLTGCATTQPTVIKVPVAMPCPKPAMPVYHDYMADLRRDAKAPAFVPACLKTRESCNNFVNAFEHYHGE